MRDVGCMINPRNYSRTRAAILAKCNQLVDVVQSRVEKETFVP